LVGVNLSRRNMATPQDVIKLASNYAVAHYKEGKNNDNIFGKWYGMNNVPWCAEFVSYCFNKVGAGALVAAGNPKGFASCTVSSQRARLNLVTSCSWRSTDAKSTTTLASSSATI
jgi:hypothetical protein